MPTRGPSLHIPNTASVGTDGFPTCCFCDKRLRAQFGGYGWNGSSHFCTKDCAAEWAERKVESVT